MRRKNTNVARFAGGTHMGAEKLSNMLACARIGMKGEPLDVFLHIRLEIQSTCRNFSNRSSVNPLRLIEDRSLMSSSFPLIEDADELKTHAH